VVALFASRGFAIVNPEMSVPTQWRIRPCENRRGVEAVISHGIVSCADDCTFLLLQPPTRFNNVYKDFTDAMDMRYAFVVGQPVAKDTFDVDLEELSRMLDRLQAMTSATMAFQDASRSLVPNVASSDQIS
jgi:hypothetical protein